MQKVSRSIFAGLLVIAGLTACGDKVTVAPGGGGTTTAATPVVHSVTVQPSSVSLKVGETVKLVATVDADATLARTVTWASGDATKASVGSDGTVTAVAPGTVAITATSTADPTVAGAATIIVQSVTAATISIGSINQTVGNSSVPADLSNVSGQLNVTLNVDQGTQTITELDLIVKNIATSKLDTVAKYFFAAANKAPVSATSAPITMSFNTAKFNDTTGAVTFVNGQYTIQAQAVVAGSTGQSPVSSTMQYTLKNTDFLNVFSHGDASATDATGRPWIGGVVTVGIVPVLYSGKKLLSATFTASGSSAAAKTDTGPFPDSVKFAVGTDTLTDSTYIVSATAKYADATSFSLSASRAADTLRVDNQPPTKANVFALGDTISGAGGATLLVPWVNGTYAFSKGLSKVVDKDQLGNPNGVGGVTTKFYALPSADTLLNTAGGATASGAAACTPPANAILAATGAAITTQSAPGDTTTYIGMAVSTDALGNTVCQNMAYLNTSTNPVGVFGVDNTAPVNAALASPASNAAKSSSAAMGKWHWVLQDSISGFTTKPVMLTTIWNYHSVATGGCTSGTVVSGVCKAFAAHQDFPVDTLTTAGGLNGDGYYTMASTISDIAGNTVVIAPRTVLIDGAAPLAGVAPTVPNGVGDSAVTYTGKVTDDVDLISARGGITYPGSYTISYPTTISPAHASFSGVRDTTGTVTLTVANHFISSLAITDGSNAPQGTALGASTHPSFVRLYGVDGVGNAGGQNLASPAVTDTAGAQVWSTAMFATFAETNPASTGTSVALTAQTTGTSSALGVPFTNVCWYVLNSTTSMYDLIGCQNLAVATQTSPTTNTWDWTGPVVAAPSAAASPLNVIAIGYGIGGSALATQVNTNIAH